MDKQEILNKNKEYIFSAITNFYEEPLVISSGKGKYMYDIDGKEYLDFFGGIVTVSVGHCNEDVTERICRQVKTIQHTSTLYLNEPIIRFAETMARITPANLKKCFFTNSGTEANETALLAAMLYTQRREIISLRHSYHGRSLMTMSLSGHFNWRIGGTHIPGLKHAHNGYCYRCAFNLKYPDCDLRCARDIEELIQTETSGAIAAFIGEPIQGVGGFITPPPEYFQIVYGIIKKYGGVFISDEVQSGFGRTGGKWWGIEQYGVQPDTIVCAKGIANGVPCGAVITTDEIESAFEGATVSTFGGNPVTSTAAVATIEYIEKHDLKNNAKVVGDYLREKLNELQEKYPVIADVRGMGLIQGLELAYENKEPALREMAVVMEETKKQGLLIGKAGLYGNALRISPPLTIEKHDVDLFYEILDRAFAETVK